jgi:hypothetical protein
METQKVPKEAQPQLREQQPEIAVNRESKYITRLSASSQWCSIVNA